MPMAINFTDAEIDAALDAEEVASMAEREKAIKYVMGREANRLDKLEARWEARMDALESRIADLAAREHTITVHQPAIKVEAPHVTVNAPEVKVAAPEVKVTVETPPMETEIIYDGDGKDRRIERTIQRKAK